MIFSRKSLGNKSKITMNRKQGRGKGKGKYWTMNVAMWCGDRWDVMWCDVMECRMTWRQKFIETKEKRLHGRDIFVIAPTITPTWVWSIPILIAKLSLFARVAVSARSRRLNLVTTWRVKIELRFKTKDHPNFLKLVAVGHFEFFFSKKKIFFCFILIQISHNLWGTKDFSKFWWLPWFPAKS